MEAMDEAEASRPDQSETSIDGSTIHRLSMSGVVPSMGMKTSS
jgi:hypothetical protein